MVYLFDCTSPFIANSAEWWRKCSVNYIKMCNVYRGVQFQKPNESSDSRSRLQLIDSFCIDVTGEVQTICVHYEVILSFRHAFPINVVQPFFRVFQPTLARTEISTKIFTSCDLQLLCSSRARFWFNKKQATKFKSTCQDRIKSFIQISATLYTLAFTYSTAYYCFVNFQEIVPVLLTSQRPKQLKTSRVTILEKQQLKLLELSKK